MAHGYILPFVVVPQKRIFVNQRSAFIHKEFVGQSLAELLERGCVREVYEPPMVCSPLSVVVSSSGKMRLVVDLRYISDS